MIFVYIYIYIYISLNGKGSPNSCGIEGHSLVSIVVFYCIPGSTLDYCARLLHTREYAG